MKSDKTKIREVELKLDGSVVAPCSYKGRCKGEKLSDVIFEAVTTKNMYFKPCKKHLSIYLRALKTDWKKHWKIME